MVFLGDGEGEGVSFGLTRPDCAEILPAKHTKNAKMIRKERYTIGRLFDYETGQLYAYTKMSFTAANSKTAASTLRIVSDSNFFAPNSEPITPPTTAAAIQNHTSLGSTLTC